MLWWLQGSRGPPVCLDDYRGRLRATSVALMATGLG